MILNHKSETPIEIMIGDSKITQEKSAKLLGVTIQDSQKWTEQITGKGGVIPSLNQRLFLIRRLKNHLNKGKLTKVANSKMDPKFDTKWLKRGTFYLSNRIVFIILKPIYQTVFI